MKTLILAGGLGTRLAEETYTIPKPMVEIGGRPIIWHIMKQYSHYGFNNFVILLGYKGYIIKEYFANYFLHHSDVTIDLAENSMEIHQCSSEPWKVTLIDTGLHTQTGGRVLRARDFVGDERFMLTYGDGVSDVDINRLIAFHESHKKLMTMTAIQPEGRFGSIDAGSDGRITSFVEKPPGDGAWINGGYFVCEPGVFDYLQDGDDTILERAPLESLAEDEEIYSYRHPGFWKCMDTLRDKIQLEELWETGKRPWVLWE